jgi:arylsulfatase A-like enzyme
MQRKRRNIVLISLDDAFSFWHYRDLFGIRLQTPNLDRICEKSTAFHNAYCQSPLCGPSRASFMSGKPPPQTGIYGNRSKAFELMDPNDMWQCRLKDDGYYCSSGGKVHHGFKPMPKNVHDVLYSDEPKRFPIDLKLRKDVARSSNGGNGGGISSIDPKDDVRYYDAHSSKSFADFLENYDRDEPFYREVGFFSPHSPFITPLRFKQMYPITDFHYPDAWKNDFDRSPTSDRVVRRNFKTWQQRHWRKSVRNYFAAFSHGDYHLGRVWDALMASRHAGNTVVILVSDHGYHLGENGRFGKSTLYEQSALVPLIIHDPDDAQPRIVREPVALLDVGPTVLDYAGLPALPEFSGRSLRSVVNGKTAARDRVVGTFNPHGASIRKASYRFLRYNDGTTELYNIDDDWWQQRNLGVNHPEYAAIEQAFVDHTHEFDMDQNAVGKNP